MADWRRTRKFAVPAVLALLAVGGARPAAAQLLPGVGGPSLPGPGAVLQGLPSTVERTTGPVTGAVDNTLSTVREVVRDTVGRPRGSASVLRTVDGVRIVRGQVLAVAPSAGALAAAQARGFTVLRRDRMAALGLTTVVLKPPEGMDAVTALAALRAADPTGQYDYNHIYDPSGRVTAEDTSAPSQRPAQHAAAIGMIDGGIDRDHPALAHIRIDAKTLAANKPGPATAHGTAVASLLVGKDGDFHGALDGATLYAADVYGGRPDGGSAEDIARALAWLASQPVAVVNISLSGPPNALLAAAIKAFLAQGHVLVAAVGNAGPAAPELYPAAYRGVVGVTSVDAQRRVQIDANRGGDVAFAARGVDVRAAALRGGYRDVTGTSFAAPVVAARFAVLLSKPSAARRARAWTALEHAAIDLGRPGRDPVFGYGLLEPPGMVSPRASTD